MNFEYDVVMPVCGKDVDILRYSLPSLEKLRPSPERIILIVDNAEAIPSDILTGHEEIVCEEDVVDLQADENGTYRSILSVAQELSSDNYLVVDSNLVLLNNFHVIDRDGRRSITVWKCGQVEDKWINTMGDAFDVARFKDRLHTCHHMIFNRKIWAELKERFMGKHCPEGGKDWAQSFYDWMVQEDRVAVGRDMGDFSEYETFANYVLANYPDEYVVRGVKARRVPLYVDRDDSWIEKEISWSKTVGCGMVLFTLKAGKPKNK